MDNFNFDYKAWFLGPKSENADLFKDKIVEAFSDYCYWRKNFHPEDESSITAKDKRTKEYFEYTEKLNSKFTEMLSQLKRSVPLFSPRYVGHMCTDLLMPGMLGYISAMFYNQNNIVTEAATITLPMESEALKDIAKMLQLPKTNPISWGHLCSGGSAANLESFWVARNLRLFPYQIELCIKDGYSELLEELKIGDKSYKDVREKLNYFTTKEIVELKNNITKLCSTNDLLAKVAEKNSLGHLGLVEYINKCKLNIDTFPKGFKILISKNTHYSVRKSLGIIGFGENDIEFIELNNNFQMDAKNLGETINRCYANNYSILCVVGVYGSTEEGTIDDFAKIIELRKDAHENKNGYFWLHSDACYGGYALSMLNPFLTENQLNEYFCDIAGKDRIDLAWSNKKCKEWIDKSAVMGESDSISIDPHKMGYIPYPAGAVLYRDYNVREFVLYEAPYINAVIPKDKINDAPINIAWQTEYLGKYTLEGSRPGAYGAALWLAHKTVPLNRFGHGKIIANTIIGAKALEKSLNDRFNINRNGENTKTNSKYSKYDIKCKFLTNEPDLNILCYTFPGKIEKEKIPLAVVNRCVDKLYTDLLPTEENSTQTKEFIISKTSLEIKEYGDMLQTFFKNLDITGKLIDGKCDLVNPWRDDDKLTLVRTVVMGPFLLNAKTKDKFTGDEISLIDKYTEFLNNKVLEIYHAVLNKPLSELNTKHDVPSLEGNVLILENDTTANRAIVKQFDGLSFNAKDRIISANNIIIAEKSIGEIEAAIVNVNLGDSCQDGGIQFLEKIVEQNSDKKFKGAVIFNADNTIYEDRINMLKNDIDIKVCPKPDYSEDNFQKAINVVMENLWDIVHDIKE